MRGNSIAVIKRFNGSFRSHKDSYRKTSIYARYVCADARDREQVAVQFRIKIERILHLALWYQMTITARIMITIQTNDFLYIMLQNFETDTILQTIID